MSDYFRALLLRHAAHWSATNSGGFELADEGGSTGLSTQHGNTKMDADRAAAQALAQDTGSCIEAAQDDPRAPRLPLALSSAATCVLHEPTSWRGETARRLPIASIVAVPDQARAIGGAALKNPTPPISHDAADRASDSVAGALDRSAIPVIDSARHSEPNAPSEVEPQRIWRHRRLVSSDAAGAGFPGRSRMVSGPANTRPAGQYQFDAAIQQPLSQNRRAEAAEANSGPLELRHKGQRAVSQDRDIISTLPPEPHAEKPDAATVAIEQPSSAIVATHAAGLDTEMLVGDPLTKASAGDRKPQSHLGLALPHSASHDEARFWNPRSSVSEAIPPSNALPATELLARSVPGRSDPLPSPGPRADRHNDVARASASDPPACGAVTVSIERLDLRAATPVDRRSPAQGRRIGLDEYVARRRPDSPA